MTGIRDIDVIVFDVLGTLVDEPGGLAAAIREAAPDTEADAQALVDLWLGHVEREQARIVKGEREYADSQLLDAEAALAVAARVGIEDPATIAHLAKAEQRLAPWEDSVAGLERLSWHFPVIGLSNASRAALLRLNAFAGLRWHQALSAESAATYKPDPAVYRLALDAAACAPERVLMVAAHAWDLRGAQAVGMRTAYIGRSVGDPPAPSDTFDGHFDGLESLAAALVT
ncbi:haloacid dehalogenase type II [Glycomyces niveus]|uniref:Haloacid dehalogenase type II n=1 Tax=Glycomyces niveus TaxID=2820287 RepID=A0ABS3U6Y0_9ACTN|nr:haloacid dehalogenase type II [Glycomyces sp. NEAU-S30]MBO3734530.1 haloacid dehalogenase type II [Glycomyces sp. NEAU-S30]